jgi:hypothetical protein
MNGSGAAIKKRREPVILLSSGRVIMLDIPRLTTQHYDIWLNKVCSEGWQPIFIGQPCHVKDWKNSWRIKLADAPRQPQDWNKIDGVKLGKYLESMRLSIIAIPGFLIFYHSRVRTMEYAYQPSYYNQATDVAKAIDQLLKGHQQ